MKFEQKTQNDGAKMKGNKGEAGSKRRNKLISKIGGDDR